MPANTIPSSQHLTGTLPTGVHPLISDALGLRHLPAPRPEVGETDTRLCVWSVRELNDVHARAGGTVTAQQIERTNSGGSTHTVIEVTVTMDVTNVGPVEVFTDWEPAAEPHGFALPVIRALTGTAR